MSIVVNVVGQTSVSVSVGGGIGPAGFITVPGTATLAFGTFQLMPGSGITVSTTDGQFLISSYSSTALSSFAPVQSVAGRTGTIVLQASDVTAGTFAIGRIPTIGYTALSGVPTAFATSSHTHDASDVASGTLLIGRIPTISYTALSNTPATFAPSAHTHSTTDVVAFTAAASAAAPVQSVQSRTGAIVLTRADITAAAEVHTHSTADVVGLTAAFSQVGHTHDAAAVASGTFNIARIPTIGYTALSGVPASFVPSSHTHSTTDVVAFTVSAAAAAPVQSVQSRTGAVVLTRADLTAAAEVHTHSTADVVAFTASASAAAPVQSVAGRTGAISLAVADITGLAGVASSGSYTSLSNVPATFAPSSHTHSTTEVVGLTASFSQPGHTHSTGDITGYQGLPAQAGYFGPLVTDGTNSTWTSRYSIVNPVLVQGAGMSFTRDTSAGQITIAFAGGTSGLAVGSLSPLALGVAAAGTSANASREDHVHKLPTVVDITAAAASHTHDAAAIASGTIDAARIPTIGYTALGGTPATFAPSAHTHGTTDVVGLTATFSQPGHTHAASDIASGTLSIARIPTIGYTALSGVPSTFAPSAHTHSTTDVVAFTAAASAAAPVQSVAGRTGAVVIASSDVSGLTSVANVVSVQSRTGTVTLAAADLTAVTSITTGVTSATAVINMISLSAAAYSALSTKVTNTLYIVSG